MQNEHCGCKIEHRGCKCDLKSTYTYVYTYEVAPLRVLHATLMGLMLDLWEGGVVHTTPISFKVDCFLVVNIELTGMHI